MIYFDNNATTRMAPEVRAAVLPFLDAYYANPSSPYAFARKTSVAIADAREAVASLVGVRAPDVVFTSGGSESINTAFHAARTLRPKRRQFVVSTVEHTATLACARQLDQQGFHVVRIPVDAAGRPDMDAYANSLTDDTALVSIMAANNETGVLFPVEEMAALAAERDIYFHCDATQAVGKMPFRADQSGMTFVSLSGHKLHAPKGIGALITAPSVTLPPLVAGGEQEQGRRAGTENVIGIVGFGAAAGLATEGPALLERRIRPLRDEMERRVCDGVDRVRVAGAAAPRLPNTSLLLFEDIPSEALLARLDMEGICCSSGSACTAGATEPSHVLAAMHLPPKYGLGAVRISFSRYTEPNEVNEFINRIGPLVRSLRTS